MKTVTSERGIVFSLVSAFLTGGLALGGCSSGPSETGGSASSGAGSGAGASGSSDAATASGSPEASGGDGAGGTAALDAAAGGGSEAATGSSGSSGSGEGGTAGTGHDGGGTPGCPAGAIFCADFESGSIPSQAVYFPAYQRAMSSMFVSVDATIAHGGTHSLKVTPGSNASPMLGVTTGTPTFWTRVYIRQDIDTRTVSGHDTFVSATDADGDPNNGHHVRIGEHSCQLELNDFSSAGEKEILSDAVNGNSNYMCAGGITFAPNTWYCLEAFYDGPNSAVRVFVDGAEATGLHVSTWGPYAYKIFELGFENYGGTPARTVWYDDVVIAPQQVGCN